MEINMILQLIQSSFFQILLPITLIIIIVYKFGKSKVTLFGCSAQAITVFSSFYQSYAIYSVDNGAPEVMRSFSFVLAGGHVAYSILVILMFVFISDGNKNTKGKNGSYLEIQTNKTLEEFSKYYLTNLKLTLSKFGNYFSIVGVIIVLQLLLGLTFLIAMLNDSNKMVLLNGFQQLLSFSMLVWLALLAKRLVNLQTEKIENELLTTIAHRHEVAEMAENILNVAKEKAETKITINGNNSVLALNGSSISGVTQSYTVQGDKELIESLALLVGYCETVGDKIAIESANKLSKEATKENYDKGVIFELWNKITNAIPQVTEIVKVVESVKGLFL
jgi:hypothetical protein